MAKRFSTPACTSQIKPTNLVRFHHALVKWYEANGRHGLPWRTTTDPYHIWLSEVMLQQTQVATVRERFYFPFLEKFPTIAALANAPRESVMKAWEGLGYYRRAGNLHEAAKQLSTQGGLPIASTPPSIDELLALSGIGRNTASAILAFAYHQPVAILEANVKRIIARVFALETPSDTALWEGAEALLNHAEPFNYNQAMMDIGSLICTPKNPKCEQCPASVICAGKTSPERYPTPKAKKQVPTRDVTIHVREDTRGRLFLEKRDEALLGGLYGFPQSAVIASDSAAIHLGHVTHVYSHFKLIGHVIHERITSKPNSPDWHTREEIVALPLSKLDHKVLALVENCHSTKKKTAKPRRAHQAR